MGAPHQAHIKPSQAFLSLLKPFQAILLMTSKAVIRYPLSVYRPSHRMTNKVLTHGSQSTVNGHQLYEILHAKHTASSQKPGASSDLAHDEKLVIRYPFTVYRLPPITSHDKQSAHARFTVNGQRSADEWAPHAKRTSSLFKPFQAFSSFFKPFQAILLMTSKAVIRDPLSVYRLPSVTSHVAHKYSSTVNGYTVSGQRSTNN